MSMCVLRGFGLAAVAVCALGRASDAGTPLNNITSNVMLPPILPMGGVGFDEILDPNGAFKGAFIVDDKLFEIVAFTPVGSTIDPTMIDIVPVNFGLVGVGFDLQGQFADVPGDGATSGFTLQYDVTVLDASKRIVDVDLIFNGFAVGQNSFTDINESVVDPMTGTLLTQLDVFASGDVPMDQWKMSDGTDFGPPGFSKLNIVKDFSVFAGTTGNANVSFIRQTFSQIPSPGAVGLGVLGLGLGLVRRRR